MRKEMRKLSRAELMEILAERDKEIQELKTRLQAAQEELANREIVVMDTGSIAESALRLNQVFESAQAAADQYLENVRRISGACCNSLEIRERMLERQGLKGMGEREKNCYEEKEQAEQSETVSSETQTAETETMIRETH